MPDFIHFIVLPDNQTTLQNRSWHFTENVEDLLGSYKFKRYMDLDMDE